MNTIKHMGVALAITATSCTAGGDKEPVAESLPKTELAATIGTTALEQEQVYIIDPYSRLSVEELAKITSFPELLNFEYTALVEDVTPIGNFYVYANQETAEYVEFTFAARAFLYNNKSLIPVPTIQTEEGHILPFGVKDRVTPNSSFFIFAEDFPHNRPVDAQTIVASFRNPEGEIEYQILASYAKNIPEAKSIRPYTTTEAAIFTELIQNGYEVFLPGLDQSTPEGKAYYLNAQELMASSVNRLVSAIHYGSSYEEYLEYIKSTPIGITGQILQPIQANRETYEEYKKFLNQFTNLTTSV